MSNTKLFFLYFTFFALGIAGLVFYDDIFIEKEVRDPSGQIAIAVNVKNDVKFKSSSQIKWFPVYNQEFFIDGDKIYTGKNSLLKLETPDKNQIDITESSLVKVRKGVLSLNRGKVTAFVEKEMNLYINGKKLRIKPSQKSIISIQKIKGQGDVISVSKGSVIVHFDGRELTLKKDQQSKINSSNVLMRAGLKGIVLVTELYENNTICEEKSLDIVWRSQVPVDKYRISIYKDVFLKNKILERTMSDNKINYEANQFFSEVYISILGFKKGKVVSQLEPQKINVYATALFPKLNLKSSKLPKGDDIEFKNSKALSLALLNSNVSLSYQSQDSQDMFKVDSIPISSINMDMGKSDLSLCFNHPSCGKKDLCHFNTVNLINSSNIALLSPKNKEVIYQIGDYNLVNFYWTIPEGFKEKDVELTIMNKAKKVLDHIIVPIDIGENTESTELSEGQYHWSVKGTNDKKMGATKAFKIIAVTPPESKVATFKGFSADQMNFSMSWNQKIYINETLIIDVKTTNELIPIKISSKDAKLKHTNISIPLSANFQWRMRGVKKGVELYETNWKTYIVPSCKDKDNFILPKIKYIAGKKPVFSWPKVEGARKYTIKLFQFDATSKQHDYSFTVKNNTFTWNKPVKVKLNWTVTPLDITGRKCQTSELGEYN